MCRKWLIRRIVIHGAAGGCPWHQLFRAVLNFFARFLHVPAEAVSGVAPNADDGQERSNKKEHRESFLESCHNLWSIEGFVCNWHG